MTVTGGATVTVVAAFSECIGDYDTWYVNTRFSTSSGVVHDGCELSGSSGTFTVSVDGVSVTTGACGTDPYGDDVYSW